MNKGCPAFLRWMTFSQIIEPTKGLDMSDDLELLIGLLEEISKGTPDGVDDRHKFLEELLKKDCTIKIVRVHIEINYDGQRFHWEVPCANITASEWTPRNLRAKPV